METNSPAPKVNIPTRIFIAMNTIQVITQVEKIEPKCLKANLMELPNELKTLFFLSIIVGDQAEISVYLNANKATKVIITPKGTKNIDTSLKPFANKNTKAYISVS